MARDTEQALRSIPAVEAVLSSARLKAWEESVPRTVVADAVRTAIEETRERILAGALDSSAGDISEAVMAATETLLQASLVPHYRKAVNATGIILHTALGRAVLPKAALDQITRELTGYSLLQADIDTGKRSARDEAVEKLLTRLTGAEAATVVNNNAAATMLALNTVGKDKEVIVSRGQLVEIGGSFRLPEVMAASGATLVEVGSTNKTHPRDYENAITENTAAIMRVHPSNYQVVGFSSEVSLADIERIAHAHDLVLIDDVGAGSLVDFSQFGFSYEPTLPDSVKGGADLITSSADKLIGGCQGGIILGKADIIKAVRKNPIARAVRVGKLTLAALEATLKLFLDEATALGEVPTLTMLSRTLADITSQAERIAGLILDASVDANVECSDSFSQMGSGSLPGQDLPTCVVAISPTAVSCDDLAARLRAGDTPVFARINEGRLLLDPRTLQEGDERLLASAVVAALKQEA